MRLPVTEVPLILRWGFLRVGRGDDVLYVQICQSVTDPNVLKKELRPFDFVRGEAKNVLVIGDPIPKTRNQDGTYVVGIADFLLGL